MTTSLEELIALNEEVALLADAGVPLDPVLQKIGRNRQHELTRIHAAVARRVGRGEPLVEAVAAEDDELPDRYQAIVEAGLRCGRLPAVLESLCNNSQSAMSLRRALSSALIYPVFIAVFAYVLFVASLVYYTPTLVETYRELEVAPSAGLRICLALRATLPIWGPISAVGLLLLIVSWIRSCRTMGWGLLTTMNWVPGVRPAMADARHAGIASLTAILLEHGVELTESLRLAAGAMGDRNIERTVNRSSQIVDRRTRMDRPLLNWAITHHVDDESPDDRIESLRLTADLYYERAELRLEKIRRAAPLVALVVLGGGMTLLYFLSVLGPFLQLMRGLV